MKGLRIGLHVVAPDAPAAVEAIAEAERLGIDAAWLTLGGTAPDSLAIFAAAAVRTRQILLGTSIVPTFPRHPFAVAQAAKAVAQLAPGRFRLGVGPSHKPTIEGIWGIPFEHPLPHLREYVQILCAALQRGGRVDHEGRFFRVHGDWGAPVDVPVLASGLRRRAFELIGEVADGAITWVVPLEHVRRVAIPALDVGAARVGRSRPAVVMHLGVVAHEDRAAVREAGMKQLGAYARIPFYRAMFVDGGFPEAADGTTSARMLDAIIVSGSENEVAGRLREIGAAGVDEVICTIVQAGSDPRSAAQRTRELLGALSQAD